MDNEARRGIPSWVWIASVVGLVLCVGSACISILGLMVGVGMGAFSPHSENGELSVPMTLIAEAASEELLERPAEGAFRVGLVADMGGVNDLSINQGAWEGLERFGEEFGDAVDVSYLECQRTSGSFDLEIDQYLELDADLIITVGYLLYWDTTSVANENPDASFAIVDVSCDPPVPNVMGITFATDEAAFLAGYLAAGMTQTGRVGTFGGIPMPTVTAFMVGFESGVNYYNEVHGTEVEVVGWNTETGEGLFTYNFESIEDGYWIGEDLIAEGADVIMPVAGPVGLGTIVAAEENPGTMVIWVDVDGCVMVPDSCPVFLTTVEKSFGNAVYEVSVQAMEGNFQGGTDYVGTLANGGVGLGPFHDYEDDIPPELLAELEEVRQGIIEGTIDTGWDAYLSIWTE